MSGLCLQSAKMTITGKLEDRISMQKPRSITKETFPVKHLHPTSYKSIQMRSRFITGQIINVIRYFPNVGLVTGSWLFASTSLVCEHSRTRNRRKSEIGIWTLLSNAPYNFAHAITNSSHFWWAMTQRKKFFLFLTLLLFTRIVLCRRSNRRLLTLPCFVR